MGMDWPCSCPSALRQTGLSSCREEQWAHTGVCQLMAPSCSSAVLVRYLREDNKVHSVNLQHAHVADGQSHSVIVRLSGLRRDTLSVELYVDCKQMDSSVGLPELSEIPLAEVESIEVRTGLKAYQRMQVSAGGIETPVSAPLGMGRAPSC